MWLVQGHTAKKAVEQGFQLIAGPVPGLMLLTTVL